jgi:hypothetical protein
MSNVPNQQQQVNLQVRYDETNAKYANQVLLNTTAEEVYLDFSPGIVADRQYGGAVLPIHTRIVMTPTGVLRLYQALGQALQNYQIVQTQPAPAPGTPQPVGDAANIGASSESSSNS